MPVVIENPILNSPYRVPTRHFRFSEDGITSDIVDGRRRSTYFVPIPQPKKKGKGQLALPGEAWTAERMESNDFINRVREHVDAWRRTGHHGVTRTTRELLDYWQDPERQRPLFFCQIEALEAAIFLAEVAGHREPWIENRLREGNDRHNPGLYRIAFKMATGSGKTVVMAMLIAWQALNKLANPQDRHFSDAFLVVTPGITIRDRLRVLLPNDPGNFYLERDIVTPELRISPNWPRQSTPKWPSRFGGFGHPPRRPRQRPTRGVSSSPVPHLLPGVQRVVSHAVSGHRQVA